MLKQHLAAEIAAIIASDVPSYIRQESTVRDITPFVAECLVENQGLGDCEPQAFALPIALINWQRLGADVPGCCGDDDDTVLTAEEELQLHAVAVFQTYCLKHLPTLESETIGGVDA